MIRMKALKSFGSVGTNEGPVRRGREFSARDLKRAQELEAHGLAYRITAVAELSQRVAVEPPPQNMAADTGPFVSAGGPIGEGLPAPSSPPAQAPRRRRSRSSVGGSAS